MESSDLCMIINKTKGKLPSLPFVSIKNMVLGEKYDLSIGILSSNKQRRINKTYRGIDKTTTILSIPLSKTSGEITLDLKKIKKDAPLFNMNNNQFLKYLLIHGCLHLKGFKHSSTMDKEERRYLKIFS